MKKLLCIISIIFAFLLVSCNIKDNNTSKVEDNISDEKVKELSVKIEANKEGFSSGDYDNPGVTFTSELEGETNKEIEYHWVIENGIEGDSGFSAEKFLKDDFGGAMEIINSGDPVKLGLFAIVCYADSNVVSELSIILRIEEKDTDNILAEDKLVIENRAGEYKIKLY